MNLTKIDENETEGTANIRYGRLLESVHISGYSMDRACTVLEWLIEDDRWMSVGPGYDDIDAFLGTITLAEFKISVERRKKLVKLLSERRATQRAAAKMLGVDQSTVSRDLVDANASEPENEDEENQAVSEDIDANASEPEIADEEPDEEPKNIADEEPDEEPAKPHVSHNSGENEWYTPPEYIDAVVNVMGGIDLDPASSDDANKTVKAAKYFTKEDSGLDKHWAGRVFMNPPYSDHIIEQFVNKFITHFTQDDVKVGIVLVNNATETAWFRKLIDCASAFLFKTGRIKFIHPESGKPTGTPLQGQAFLYFGNEPEKFLVEFNMFGWGAILGERHSTSDPEAASVQAKP